MWSSNVGLVANVEITTGRRGSIAGPRQGARRGRFGLDDATLIQFLERRHHLGVKV